jgi:hypothetical protein
MFHAYIGAKGSLFWLLLRLYHVMLDIILIICLVVIFVAWLVSYNCECLMCLWKNHALFLSYRSNILLWYSPLMLYLGWLAHAHTMFWLQTSCLKPLWSFGFWLVISLYALVNNVLSLCMIMVVIALLVGHSQSFASHHLYWVWALLVHPTPKNQSYFKESTINSYAWHFKPFQANFYVLPFKTFKILLILWHYF